MELAAVRGIEHCSQAFLRELVRVAERLAIDPNWLLAVISFETAGTFRSDILAGGATWSEARYPSEASTPGIGLLQFTYRYARQPFGVTAADLAAMSPVAQLEYVERYLAQGAPYGSLCDLYCAVFWPAARGKPDGYIAIARSSASTGRYYAGNARLDRDRDGTITRGEICGQVRGIYAAAAGRAPVVVDMEEQDPASASHWEAVAVGLVLVTGLFLWTVRARKGVSHA